MPGLESICRLSCKYIRFGLKLNGYVHFNLKRNLSKGHKYEDIPYTDKLKVLEIPFKKALKGSLEDIEKRIILAMCESVGNPDLKIERNVKLSNYGIDSLDLMEALTIAEIEYDFIIDDEDIDKIHTIKDILEVIDNNYKYYDTMFLRDD